MNLLNLTNLLALFGFIGVVVSLISFDGKKDEKRSVAKTILAVSIGLSILVVTIIKNNQDEKEATTSQSKSAHNDTLIQNLHDTTLLLHKKMVVIDTLTAYIKKVDSIGVKRDSISNNPIITNKIYQTYIEHVKNLTFQ